MKALKIIIILALIATAGWFGWHRIRTPKVDPQAAAAASAMQGPVPVSVATLKPQPIQQWLQFSGRLVAVETVEIRPRVGGAIQTIYFQPGEIVEKDAPLFLIDPRPYAAEVNRAKATLAGAEAQNTLSDTDLQRAQRLVGENAISRRDVDTRQNANRVAGANLKSAQALVETAQLNLNYATIKSPIRGRISRAEITLGNLVNTGNATPLATIVSVDSIYADFEVDEQTYISMIRKQSAGGPNAGNGDGNEANLPVELVLNSDDRADQAPAMSYSGKIVSFDNQLNSASGTIRARAIFDNKDKALVPGMFANVRLGEANVHDGIVIPERLISTDQDKKYVYVVANGKVTYRPVTLGGTSQGQRIITNGLQAGDQVITDGLVKLRPDMPAVAHEVPLTTSAADGAAPAVATAERLAAIAPASGSGAAATGQPLNQDAPQKDEASTAPATAADGGTADVTPASMPIDPQNAARASGEPPRD